MQQGQGCAEEEVCLDGICVPEDCVHIDCPAGELCAADLNCYPEDCSTMGCGEYELCFEGECTDQLCVGVQCPPDQVCAAGNCYPQDCTAEQCDPGQVCEDEICIDDDCAGGRCCPAETCTMDLQCVTSECDGVNYTCLFDQLSGMTVWSEQGESCTDVDPCTLNDVCAASECVGEPVMCDTGESCILGQCRCGATGPDCGGGDVCCGADCFDLNTSMDHCGMCNSPCIRDHAKAECEGGECSIDECAYLYDDCDGIDENGCETSLEQVTDCGSCGSPCNSPNATASCEGGTCHIGNCDPDFWDVDAIDANGCECQDSPEVIDMCGFAQDVGVIGATAPLVDVSGKIVHRIGYREDLDCFMVTYDSPNPGDGTFRVGFNPDPGNLKFDVWRADCLAVQECTDSVLFETVCVSIGGACESGNGSIFYICVHAAAGEDLLCQDYALRFEWQ
jgi:hypothetical protein